MAERAERRAKAIVKRIVIECVWGDRGEVLKYKWVGVWEEQAGSVSVRMKVKRAKKSGWKGEKVSWMRKSKRRGREGIIYEFSPLESVWNTDQMTNTAYLGDGTLSVSRRGTMRRPGHTPVYSRFS